MLRALWRGVVAFNRAVVSGEGWHSAWEALKAELGPDLPSVASLLVSGVGFISLLVADISWAGIAILSFCLYVAARHYAIQSTSQPVPNLVKEELLNTEDIPHPDFTRIHLMVVMYIKPASKTIMSFQEKHLLHSHLHNKHPNVYRSFSRLSTIFLSEADQNFSSVNSYPRKPRNSFYFCLL